MDERETFLSKKEQFEIAIIHDFQSGRISRRKATELLGVSERQVQRKRKKIETKGVEGVKHGNCGRIPHNRKKAEDEEKVMNLVEHKYFDFNM